MKQIMIFFYGSEVHSLLIKVKKVANFNLFDTIHVPQNK